MRRHSLLIILLFCFTSVSAQHVFNEISMNMIQSLIADKNHDEADSVIDDYLSRPQNKDVSFYLNLMKCFNGYCKIQTYEDPSVIIPYSEYGKKAFDYIRENLNNNAHSWQCWPLFSMWAEIYNYLNDSIIVEVSNFSSIYYAKYKEHDLYSYYNVLINTYQYYCSRGEWDNAANVMRKYMDVANESKDTTVRKPIAAVYIGDAYLHSKEYQNAEFYYMQSYQLLKKKHLQNQLYCEMLSHLIIALSLSDQYTKALVYAREHRDVCKSLYGELSKEYANAQIMLSNAEMALGKVVDAMNDLEIAVNLFEKVSIDDDSRKQSLRFRLNIMKMYLNSSNTKIDVSASNIPLLEAYNETIKGNVIKAVSLYRDLIASLERGKGDNSIYCFAVQELSSILLKEGKYAEADKLMNHSLEYIKGTKYTSDEIRILYLTKGLVLHSIHNVKEALRWYNMARTTYTEEEKRTIGYGRLLSNIAFCLDPKTELDGMKKMVDEANNIYTTALGIYGSNNLDILQGLNNLGYIYAMMNDYNKGIEIFEYVIDNCVSKQTEMIKSLALFNLSVIYLCKNMHEKAETCLDQAYKLKNPMQYIISMDLYSLLIKCLKKDINVASYLNSFNSEVKNSIASVFGQFSELERDSYWVQYSRYLSLCNNYVAMNFKESLPTAMAFDNVLFTKSMLLNSEKFLESAVKNSNNKDAQNNYLSIKDLKKRLSGKEISADSISIIIDSISNLEKIIISSIPDFSSKLLAQFKTMEDVKCMLSDNEIALEFTLLPHIQFPIEKTTYHLGAFILSKDSTDPIIVELCPNNELENLFSKANATQQVTIDSLYNISDTRLFQMIWSKLLSFIPSGSTIYYSPSGSLNKINLSAISDGSKRLSEIYRMYEVSTTANIGIIKNNVFNIKSAVMYGDINYFEDIDQMAYNSSNYNYYSSGDFLATRSLSRGTWDLLPGTKVEITSIAALMSENGIHLTIYDQNKANEESFKSLDGKAPDIVHVSTHGFYYSSNDIISSNYFIGHISYTQKELSMFHSGLLFAGANNAWLGKPIPNGVEDGILTADEISRIDLSNNKLMVLSACETGLGDIDSIDGVFGLQRGLKRAGANTILMSLWKVPDEETTFLMTIFYKYLLDGKSAHDSLLLAQNELKEMGKSPYYWAGFILLD